MFLHAVDDRETHHKSDEVLLWLGGERRRVEGEPPMARKREKTVAIHKNIHIETAGISYERGPSNRVKLKITIFSFANI